MNSMSERAVFVSMFQHGFRESLDQEVYVN